MSALTGVGPSIASGSQVWSGTCADFATAPPRSPSAISVIAQSPPMSPTRSKTAPYSSVPTRWIRKKSDSAIVASPNAFMMKAFFAAAIAAGRSWS